MKKRIQLRDTRLLLSEILPYEVPLIFSNQNFYKFLLSVKFTIKDHKINFDQSDPTKSTIMRILLGLGENENIPLGGITTERLYRKFTIPFTFRIAHGENDFRHLSIVHPMNQLLMVNFYNQYRSSILYHCNKSPFSIRYPSKSSKHFYFRDSIHFNSLVIDSNERIEQNSNEYNNFRSYFVYKKYSNIYKFYESYQYRNAEKKFNFMTKFDIAKCFDNIYTHSIAWSIYGKTITKESLREIASTFPGEFDTVMQQLNYKETNGIVIGPEFSRLFAEVILQRIDVLSKEALKEENIIHKRDYELFRYVDDHFVFYNDEIVFEKILSVFRIIMSEYKLSINNNKIIKFSKPIITNITIAKRRINQLFSNLFEPIHSALENVKPPDFKINISSNHLIVTYKTILVESDTKYEDLLNYSFFLLESHIIRLIKIFQEIEYPKKEKKIQKVIIHLIDFIFFIYSASPKVNTTIALCRCLSLFLSSFKETKTGRPLFVLNYDQKHLIFKHIFDNSLFVIRKMNSRPECPVETLYLLILLGELGNKYWLTENVLAEYLHIEVDENNNYINATNLNYFVIITALFYMKDKKRYDKLRNFFLDNILLKFEAIKKERRWQNTELTLLFLDILSYPYLKQDTLKRKLLDLFNIKNKKQILNYSDSWFSTWEGFDFTNELIAKKGFEVY